ncbi:MAG: DUF5615 family PIN-like protein [Bryobacteraceae bacterium]
MSRPAGLRTRCTGHDVDMVRTEHLAGRADDEGWQAAQPVNRFLIMQDLDFSDVRQCVPGTHAGLLRVCLAPPGRDAPIARVAMLFATEPVRSGARLADGRSTENSVQSGRLTRTLWSVARTKARVVHSGRPRRNAEPLVM